MFYEFRITAVCLETLIFIVVVFYYISKYIFIFQYDAVLQG